MSRHALALRSNEDLETWSEVAVTWFCRFAITILVGLFTVIGCRCCRASPSVSKGQGRDQSVQTDPVAQSTVASQSPVTYTSVRGCLQPRFQVLPAVSHG